MISGKKTLSMLLVALLAVVAITVVVSDDSSATGIGSGEAGDFKEDKDGTISIPVANDTGGEITMVFKVYVDVDDVSSATPKKTVTETVPADGCTVDISLSMGAGTHKVTIVASSDTTSVSPDTTILEIHVDKSIWSNITTYLALIAIVIVIAIAAFYYMRSKPKKVGGTTFTELEAQKKAEKAAEPAPAKTGTEKRRYSKPAESEAPTAKEPAPAPEKKPQSFTEMENAKKAKKKEPVKQEPVKTEPAKKEPAKKEPSKDDSSKKIKYVSSRRK